MANLSDLGDHTRGTAPQAFSGFTYRQAAFAEQEAFAAGSGALEDASDQAGRLSVLSAGVAISVASAACWGALAAIVLVLV